MPSRVIDLFACWKAQGGRTQFGAFGGKGNNWSFEDRKRTLVDLKALFFKTLYHWVVAFDFNISSFHIF